MNEKIVPHQSSSKLVFIILGIILMIWSIIFSIFLITQGAWPVSLFLGVEYLLIVFLTEKMRLLLLDNFKKMKIRMPGSLF